MAMLMNLTRQAGLGYLLTPSFRYDAMKRAQERRFLRHPQRYSITYSQPWIHRIPSTKKPRIPDSPSPIINFPTDRRVTPLALLPFHDNLTLQPKTINMLYFFPQLPRSSLSPFLIIQHCQLLSTSEKKKKTTTSIFAPFQINTKNVCRHPPHILLRPRDLPPTALHAEPSSRTRGPHH